MNRAVFSTYVLMKHAFPVRISTAVPTENLLLVIFRSLSLQMSMTVFWVVAPFSLVGVYWSFTVLAASIIRSRGKGLIHQWGRV